MAKSSGFSAGQKALQAMGVATAPSSPITQQKSNTSGQTPGQNALKAAGISGYQQSSTPQTGYGSSSTSREDEIYKALTAGMQQNQENSSEPSFIDWAGRQDLVNKYNQLQESTGFVTTVEQSNELEAQMKAIREQIDAGDIKFGNGLQSFGAADRAKNVFEGATNQYLAGLVNNAAMLVQHQGDTVDYAMRNGEFADWLNENGYELSENSLQGGETIRQAARDYLEPAADYLADTGAQNIEAAKGGLGTFGQGAVDLATNAIQMGYDVGMGKLLGGGPGARKAAMFIRTLGSAGQEARRDENSNATNNQQLAYGITKGGIEVATEMMFDGLAGIMGKGGADVVVEKVVSKLAKSNFGRTVLRSLIETGGEGFEEVISDVLDPYAKMIYNGKGLKETFKEGYDVSELLYSFLIGAAMGGFGQVGSVATGQHAAKNLALELQDAQAAAFNQRYGLDEAIDALMGTSRNGQSGFNGRWGLQNNAQATAQQNPAASSVTGLIKNAPDPNNNSQKYVATQLEALDEAAAKNIASDERYVSAFEDLTDLPLSGTPEQIAQQILDYAQEATGAQEVASDESVPPAPQTASTEPPAALNSNQSEIAPQEATEQATNPATEALLNPVIPGQEDARSQLPPKPLRSGADMALWALGLDQQNQQDAREAEGVDIDAADFDDSEAEADDITARSFMVPGLSEEAQRYFAREEQRVKENASEKQAEPQVATEEELEKSRNLYGKESSESGEDAYDRRERERMRGEATARVNRRKFSDEDSGVEARNRSKGSYYELRITARAQIEDDARNISRIVEGKDEWSTVSARYRADLLNDILETDKYYTRGNEVVAGGNASDAEYDSYAEDKSWTRPDTDPNGRNYSKLESQYDRDVRATQKNNIDYKHTDADVPPPSASDRRVTAEQKKAYQDDLKERERKERLKLGYPKKAAREATDQLYGLDIQQRQDILDNQKAVDISAEDWSEDNAILETDGRTDQKSGQRSWVDDARRTRTEVNGKPQSGLELLPEKAPRRPSVESERSRDRVRNHLITLGFKVSAEGKESPRARSFIDLVRSVAPGCPVTVFSSDGVPSLELLSGRKKIRDYGSIFIAKSKGKLAGIFIDEATVESQAKKVGCTTEQAIMHDVCHYCIEALGIDEKSAIVGIVKNCGDRNAAVAALTKAYNHCLSTRSEIAEMIGKADPGAVECAAWNEVISDYFAGIDRDGSGDSDVHWDIVRATREYFNDFEAKTGTKAESGGDIEVRSFNRADEADVENDLNARDQEIDDLERRDHQREEDEYQEKRWGDKHTMENAKGWAAQERANAKAESEANPFPKHDVARQFGEENRRDIQRTVRNLAKNTSKPVDGNEAKREFDSATYGKAQKLIEAVSEFANGNMSLRELADVYSAMKGKGETSDNAFYEKSIDDTLRDLADTLDEEEKRWQHWSEDGRFVDNTGKNQGEYKAETAKAVAEAIKDLNYRLQYIGRTGVTPRADLTNEVTSNKGKQKTGTAKTVADISKKFTGMQLRPDTMFKLWGGFKKGSKLYQFAEKHYKAISDKQNAHRAAVEYFITATQMKGYKDFASGKTTIDNPIPGHSDSKLSLNTALGLLKTLETNGAIEHIIENGAQFAISESEYYKGQNNNGFGDTPEYGQTLSLLSDKTLDRLKNAKEGKDIAHARSAAHLELEALRDALKAEVMKNEVAKALYEATPKCMSYLGRNINSSSRTMYGKDFATEGKSYYPLEIAGKGNKNELLNDPRSDLKNWSRVKERTGDSGALRIRAFTDVMSGYIDQATDWAAFSVLSDELELLSRNNGKQSGLKAVVGSNFGRYYSDWLENYVADLNGTRKAEGVQFTGLRSNLASAALTLNGGVALKQSPSYWDAAGVIDMKYLVKHSPGLLKTAKSFANNPLIQEVEMRTGMLGERKLGLGVVEVGEATENARSLSNKVNGLLPNWMTNWISKTDVRTTSNLMLACADQVLADDPNLKAGTEKYYKAVADKFEEVILKTQPVYTKQARADYMRVQNDVIRTLAMFRTQQTQNFNQLVTAVGEYRNAYGKDKVAAAKQLRQVAVGQVVGSTMFAILSAVAKAGLHKWDDFEDEEGNFDAGKTAKRVGLNFLGSVAATVWFGDKTSAAVIDALTGGKTSEFSGLEDNVLSMVSDAVTSGISFAKNRDLKSASSLVFNLSQALGIPTRNAYNLFNSAAMFGLDGDRALTGGSVMNDGKTNDLIRMVSNYNKQTDKQRARATFDAAMRASAKGNNEKAETLMATLDYGNEDVVGAIKAAAKERFALGEIDMATYQKILTKWGQMSASDAKAYAEGQEEKRELAELMENDAVAQLDQQISDAKDRADEYDSSRDYAAMDLIIGALLDDADTDKLVRAKTSKGFRTSYEAMRQAGMTPKEVSTTYKAMDGDNNGSLKQDELVEYYLANPGMEYIIKQIWATKGWKTSWETKRDKAK